MENEDKDFAEEEEFEDSDLVEDEEDEEEEEEDEIEEVELPTESTKKEKSPNAITIFDIFPLDTLTPAGSGTYKMECPDCGMQGGRTEGFIIFPDGDRCFCHSSHKNFSMLEAYALKKKIIRCMDGKDTGEKKKVLGGELYTLTLEEFKADYGTDKFKQLMEDLGVRTRIEIPGDDRLDSEFADDLADIYKSRNVLFFRGESGKVIEIFTNRTITAGGETTIERGFKEMVPNRFVTFAEMLIEPWTTKRFPNGGKIVVKRSMTSSHADKVLNSPNFQKQLPILMRIFDIQIPALYRGELTFPKKGYDKRFGSWLPYTAPQIKKDMFNLGEAVVFIDSIFEEFCFTSEKDRIHAIASFLTPFCRGMFGGKEPFSTRTPVSIYMANRERAGKDYCAGCTGMLYEGIATENPPISNDEKGSSNSNEELKKKITACMIAGTKRFHSSNNKGLLNNSVFESVTTTKTWQDRVLGKSVNVTYPNEMDYSLSGNLGIRLTPDLANRARIINLHLIDEDANARIFKRPKLHEWILENREKIISALYKLVENWVMKGMPPGSVPFSSFPEWSRVVGGIMECAGYMNPCEKDESEVIDLDPESAEMKLLFETGYEKHPNKWLSKGELQRLCEEENIMPYINFSDKNDLVKFGIKIDKYFNRKMSDILLKVDSLKVRAARRRYMFYKDETLFFKPEISVENKNDQIGQVGQIGQVSYITPNSHMQTNSDNGYLANPANLAKESSVNDEKIEKQKEFMQQTIPGNETREKTKTDKTLIFKEYFKDGKIPTLEDLEKKSDKYLEHERKVKAEERKKEKTDRELQFWEDPQCADIVEQCTKEQVYMWIANNPRGSYELMDKALGVGCLKHALDLYLEGKVMRIDRGWEVVNVRE